MPTLIKLIKNHVQDHSFKVNKIGRLKNYSSTLISSLELESSKSYTDPLLSPLLTKKEHIGTFPPTLLISTDIDPCLDETVAFSNKLFDANVKVELEVFSGIPHGFLSLSPASKDCSDAVDFITEKLRDFILS